MLKRTKKRTFALIVLMVFALTSLFAQVNVLAGSTLNETESLAVSASSGDIHRTFGYGSGADANLSGGYGTILEANAVGDYVSYTVNVPQSGTCNVRVGVKKTSSRGTFQLSVNSVNHGSIQDLYSASDSYTELDVTTFDFASSGSKTFTFKVTGKNASSSSYWLGLDYIKLIFGPEGTGTTVSGSGLSATVYPSGDYTITSTDPAMTFKGMLDNQTLSGIGTTTGTDTVGSYNEVYFSYSTGKYEGRIRVYNNSKPVIVFKTTSLDSANSNLGPYFPAFSTIPSGFNSHGFNGTFSEIQFSRSGIGTDSPGIFYDNSANTFIISPASHFMDAYMSYGNSGIKCGLQNWPNSTYGVKNGYTHSVMLVIDKGINHTFDTWGKALTDFQGKTRPTNEQDMGLKNAGFWTDQQGPYWYNLNGFANYDDLLMAVKAKYDSLKIKMGYYQLDSWWYIKDPSNWMNRPGCYLYEPVPSLFPNGLLDLNTRLGAPYITHNRWIGGNVPGDVRSPYRDQYIMSNGVSIDPLFWDKIIGDIAKWGVKTYEQDWLDANASASNTLGHGEKFMDEMARATSANGMTMQYCMGDPRNFMQASKYNNVTTLRSCGDRFHMTSDWSQHLFCSQLIKAVGSWPWVDNFRTNELGNVLLCDLSAGMVGFSDEFANITDSGRVANVLKTIRRDSVAVKPDVPLLPSDATYIRKSAGNNSMTCSTYSQFTGKKIVYIWDWANGRTNYTTNFKPSEFGMSGNVYVYNYFNNSGVLVDSNTIIQDVISGSTAGANGTDWKYYIASPVGASGMALIGDTGKFATCGKKRITDIAETTTTLTVTATFGAFDASNPDQKATIVGYSPVSVTVTAGTGGTVSNFSYNATTKVFKFDFVPSGSYTGEVTRTVDIVKN